MPFIVKFDAGSASPRAARASLKSNLPSGWQQRQALQRSAWPAAPSAACLIRLQHAVSAAQTRARGRFKLVAAQAPRRGQAASTALAGPAGRGWAGAAGAVAAGSSRGPGRPLRRPKFACKGP